MAKLAVRGAGGSMGLLAQHEAETGRLCRSLSLEAGDDGRSVVLVELDERKAGIPREHRIEMTTSELIALIRVHGVRRAERVPVSSKG
jgi:hypothetical protein